MIRSDVNPTFYEALDAFRQRALLGRRSISLGDEDATVDRVWTSAAVDELVRHFIDHPDTSSRSFMEKLRLQLAGASRESVQLLTDLTWLYAVVALPYRVKQKRQLLAEVAEIGSAQVPGGVYDRALELGIAATGTSYYTRRPNQLALLVRFAEAWLQMSSAENERLLRDPWAFRELVFGLDGVADQTQRHALLHLIHPATFEDILSQYHKRRLVDALVPGQTFDNVDRAIAAARVSLTGEHGASFNFYDPDVRPLWDGGAEEVDVGNSNPSEEDVDAEGLEPAIERRAWLIRGSGGERVPEWLHDGRCAIYFEDSFPFTVEPGLTREQLRAKAEEAGADTSAGGFNHEIGQVWRFVNEVAIGDYIVTVNGQDIYIGIVNSEARSVGGRARRETYREVEWANPEAPIARSSLDPAVYSKLKTLLTLTNITSVVEHLERWVSGHKPGDGAPVSVAPAAASVVLPRASEALASELLMPQPWLDATIDLLAEKKQLVLYGPPGTGKTFLAQQLADHLTANGGDSELVQFHPSYAYEDFFEGFRPAAGIAGSVNFELKPGPLRRIAQLAQSDPARPYVLIIDEINRANLAKVFGELYFLLEYRGRAITLQYSDEEFSLPENLFVIATMNTADRSIALVDAAMRRRFYFVAMSPDREPVKSLLRSWLKKQRLPMDLADLLDELNRRIGDADAAIGPSYLMTKAALEPAGLERIWEHAILPLLQERFYGTRDADLQRFALREVSREAAATREPAGASDA